MRTYHQLTDPDRSGLAEQIGAQRKRVAERLAAVRRIVAVMSGKGGVGKSYVAAHLARGLARACRDAVRPAMGARVEHGSGLLGIVEDMVGRGYAGAAADDLSAEFGAPVLAGIPWHATPDVWNHLVTRIPDARRTTDDAR